MANLSTAFSLLATLLAAIGLYGVVAYTVGRRTREIGIRMALGASRASVVWLVMKEIAILAGAGIAVGLLAAWGLTGFVRQQLYGVQPNDLTTVVFAAVAIALVAGGAGYLPARRAPASIRFDRSAGSRLRKRAGDGGHRHFRSARIVAWQDGGTGRRNGLKIRRDSLLMRVRPPLPATSI